MSDFSIPRNYQRRQCYVSTQQWLSKQGLVIAGYWDKVAGVNLLHLVGLWREAQLDGETLEDQYPYAAEYFKIRVVSEGDQAHLRDILPGASQLCKWTRETWGQGDKGTRGQGDNKEIKGIFPSTLSSFPPPLVPLSPCPPCPPCPKKNPYFWQLWDAPVNIR